MVTWSDDTAGILGTRVDTRTEPFDEDSRPTSTGTSVDWHRRRLR
jgi:hypothetical protein